MDDPRTLKLVVSFDPQQPEVFFEYLDNLGVDLIRQMRFATVEQVTNLLESIEQAKVQVMSKIEESNSP